MKENFLLKSVTQEVQVVAFTYSSSKARSVQGKYVFAEGLPLYFRTENGVMMPERGTYTSGN